MKLATLKTTGRDGRLVVVSRDTTQCYDVSHIAQSLQFALDNWSKVSVELEAVAQSVANRSVPLSRFHEHDAASPLPRAFQWVDGSAYVNHVELVTLNRSIDTAQPTRPRLAGQDAA